MSKSIFNKNVRTFWRIFFFTYTHGGVKFVTFIRFAPTMLSPLIRTFETPSHSASLPTVISGSRLLYHPA